MFGTATTAQSQPTASVKVAAVQFAGQDAHHVDAGCSKRDVNCAIAALVRRAAQQGASLVVTPEHALHQTRAEPTPRIGKVPHGQASPISTRFARLAKELGIYLVIHLHTKQGKALKSTQVAFSPTGQVVGLHHKFELYGRERNSHTPGEDVMVFETPFARVGLLICADLYGDPRLHDKLTRELDADIVAVSAMWTVPRATRWQAAFARDWGVYLVASNGTAGEGRGGGVFDQRGRPVALDEAGEPSVSIGSIPTLR